jgi:hypothetical protein
MHELLPLNAEEAQKLASMMGPDASPCELRRAARSVKGKVIADAIKILQEKEP